MLNAATFREKEKSSYPGEKYRDKFTCNKHSYEFLLISELSLSFLMYFHTLELSVTITLEILSSVAAFM